MKYMVYAALVFVGMLVFLPKNGESYPDNLPLLIAIIAGVLLFYFVRVLRRIILLLRLRKLLVSRGMEIRAFSLMPNFFGKAGRYDIVAVSDSVTLNILLLIRKRAYYRYHFDSVRRLDYYKSNRLVFRSTAIKGATMSDAVETNCVGHRRLPWRTGTESNGVDILIIDCPPARVTDSVRREELSSGDRICSQVYYYDYPSFIKAIDGLIP